MTETVGHGAQVDAGGEQFGGHEVAEAVELDVFESGSFAESFPSTSDQLWPPRDSCGGVVGEHEVVSAQGSTCHAGSFDGLVVERGE